MAMYMFIMIMCLCLFIYVGGSEACLVVVAHKPNKFPNYRSMQQRSTRIHANFILRFELNTFCSQETLEMPDIRLL